ncbi:hypothetical protein [Streptomyces sp. CBMA156]|uniref:hypothetical protein n=1 Tax=Streptomyces sp. CBMA156 TaxID=1930280 RepID=UPI001661A56D|nr:hypothetical protein [Streptomyces sp. CBMA156]MBD0676017.1 hypothetical protein [Streptomyces sp. CBMA156]
MSTIKTADVALAALTALAPGAAPAMAAGDRDQAPLVPEACNASGGTFHCGGDYGDGTEQLFVIGTDFDVWTGWFPPKGGQAPWMSLGGDHDFVDKVKINNKKGDAFTIGARSFTIGAGLYRDRSADGRQGFCWPWACHEADTSALPERPDDPRRAGESPGAAVRGTPVSDGATPHRADRPV